MAGAAERSAPATARPGLVPLRPADANEVTVTIDYLFRHRPQWGASAVVSKTVVSTELIDRVAARLGRPLFELAVVFKWFSPGLLDGSLGFAGEESAGAAFPRRDGRTWTSAKDGLIAGLLAAEITAHSGRDLAVRCSEVAQQLGESIGGIKVMTPSRWHAARPSGTDEIYKIHAESFESSAHLKCILAQAQTSVDSALARDP